MEVINAVEEGTDLLGHIPDLILAIVGVTIDCVGQNLVGIVTKGRLCLLGRHGGWVGVLVFQKTRVGTEPVSGLSVLSLNQSKEWNGADKTVERTS